MARKRQSSSQPLTAKGFPYLSSAMNEDFMQIYRDAAESMVSENPDGGHGQMMKQLIAIVDDARRFVVQAGVSK